MAACVRGCLFVAPAREACGHRRGRAMRVSGYMNISFIYCIKFTHSIFRFPGVQNYVKFYLKFRRFSCSRTLQA
jgi:hypothetical protein